MIQTRRMFLCLWLLCLAMSPLTAQQSAAPVVTALPPDVVVKIDAVIQDQMQRQGIPGLSAAVVVNDQVVWTKGYGLADVEHHVPVTDTTVYQWASLSKPVTAIAVMQLAQSGKLDLDAPIQKYVPSFPEKPWPVTPRELLGHLGGIRHYQEGDYEASLSPRYPTIAQTLVIFSGDPLVAEPGTKYHYSSFGYNVLGAAVEGASGLTYADYVRRFVFAPAGLFGIQIDGLRSLTNHAKTYIRASDGVTRPSPVYDVVNKIPSAGFCSNVTDMARFGIAVTTGRLVRRDTLEQMWTEQKTRDGQPTGYGLGWFVVRNRAGRRVISHDGVQSGVSTLLSMQPDQHCAVALMCNLDHADLWAVEGPIMDQIVLNVVLKQSGK